MTNILASPPDAASEGEDAGTLIVFRLADQSYALPLADVCEVLPMAELSRPPGLPSILEGFLNLAGRAVPVVGLGRLFGLPDHPLDLYTPLLIVAVRGRLVALMAEKVTETVNASRVEIVPLEKGHSFNGCARGMVRKGESTILLLSPERILLEEEMQCLEQYRAVEQQRLQAIENQFAGDREPAGSSF